jgi:hypothetical protein
MDSLDEYRRIVRDTLTRLASAPYSVGDLTCETVFDRDADRYLAVTFGWDHEGKRVNECVVHVDIVDGKLWIRCDNTDWVVAQELAGAGVPKDRIVLGFWPPEIRKRNTEFAAA